MHLSRQKTLCFLVHDQVDPTEDGQAMQPPRLIELWSSTDSRWVDTVKKMLIFVQVPDLRSISPDVAVRIG
jgi:hypothetical protein